MKNLKVYANLFLLIFIVFAHGSCQGDPEAGVSEETYKVNKFIYDGFDLYYLWNKEMPDVDIKKESDSYTLFKKLMYKDDKWSRLSDDAKNYFESFTGTTTTFGYSLDFYYISESNKNILAVVQYVHPHSPADKVGIKRGDIFLKMNGVDITEDNYRDLVYASQIELEYGILENNELVYTGNKVKITAVKDYMEPILLDSIYEQNGKKIAYLLYTDYLLKSHQQLKAIFTKFSQANVDELILDLRYNSGGYALTSQILSSMIVPKSVLDNNDIYLEETYNQLLNKEFAKDRIKRYYHEYVYKNENDVTESVKIENHLNLSRVFVITGKNTASASEATIAGLKPYLDLVLVGEKTSGKYNGGIILTPDLLYKNPDKSILNWGMYVMIYRYMNKNGFPESLEGIMPDYSLPDEKVLSYRQTLGDLEESRLSTVMDIINGNIPQEITTDFDNSQIRFEALRATDMKAGRMIELNSILQIDK